MATRSFRNMLESPELARLKRLANAQQQLDRQWQAALPPEMATQSCVVGIELDCLVVSTRSPAIVAKIRQMEVRLLAKLGEQGLKLNAIRCRVQVETFPHERKKTKRNLVLSPAALAALGEAAAKLPASPLREALNILLSKRRK